MSCETKAMTQRVPEPLVVEVPLSTIRVSGTPEDVGDTLIGSCYFAIHVLAEDRSQRSQGFNELQSAKKWFRAVHLRHNFASFAFGKCTGFNAGSARLFLLGKLTAIVASVEMTPVLRRKTWVHHVEFVHDFAEEHGSWCFFPPCRIPEHM